MAYNGLYYQSRPNTARKSAGRGTKPNRRNAFYLKLKSQKDVVLNKKRYRHSASTERISMAAEPKRDEPSVTIPLSMAILPASVAVTLTVL